MIQRRLSLRIQLLLLCLALCLLTSHLNSRSRPKNSRPISNHAKSFFQTAKSFKSDFASKNEQIRNEIIESMAKKTHKSNHLFI